MIDGFAERGCLDADAANAWVAHLDGSAMTSISDDRSQPRPVDATVETGGETSFSVRAQARAHIHSRVFSCGVDRLSLSEYVLCVLCGQVHVALQQLTCTQPQPQPQPHRHGGGGD